MDLFCATTLLDAAIQSLPHISQESEAPLQRKLAQDAVLSFLHALPEKAAVVRSRPNKWKAQEGLILFRLNLCRSTALTAGVLKLAVKAQCDERE